MLRKPALSLVFLLAIAAAAAQQPSPFVDASSAAPKQHPVSAHHRNEALRLFMQGAKDLQHNQPRQAIALFQRAAKLDPEEQRYAVSIGVARQRLASGLVRQADRETSLGHTEAAAADIQQAYALAPGDPIVDEHVQSLAASAAPREPTIPDNGIAAGPPVQLEPTPGLRSFHDRMEEGSLVEKVFAAYGIHPTLDSSVKLTIVPFDVDNLDFVHAERALALATNTFFVPLDPHRVLVAADTRENRDKFERLAMETFSLNGMSTDEATQMVNLAREEFSAKTAFTDASADTITVRAPVEDLQAFKNTLNGLVEGRDQIRLDVVMYEVDRTKATSIGAILPTQTTLFNVYSEANQILQQNSSLVDEIISSGLAQPGQWEQILAILVASGQLSSSILNNPFVTFGGGLTLTGLSTSGGIVNMQLNSSDVHAVDQMQLRLADQEEGTLKVGERYPIVTSSYGNTSSTALSIAGISSSGLSSTLENLGISLSSLTSAAAEEIPQIQYQDIGLTLDVTPRIESAKGVSLRLDLKLTALNGATINDLPVLNNREYQAITSLNLGESAVLVSALSRQQSNAISGLPGLDEIPGFDDATDKDTTLDYSELAIVITPYIVSANDRPSAERMMVLPPAPAQ